MYAYRYVECVAPPKTKDRKPSYLGAKIKQLREERGLSQEALAARAGFEGRGPIAKLESGTQQGADVSTIGKLAVALGVAHGDLVEKSGWTRLDGLLEELKLTALGSTLTITDGDLEMLRDFPTAFWLRLEPNVDALFHIIVAIQKRRAAR